NLQEILSKVDHTLLSQTATFDDIKAICDDGIKYSVASVCIPPCYVARAKNHVGSRLKICTVIGFPNGYNDTETKKFETKSALNSGADEIDMVINIGALKDKKYDYVLKEISEIKELCGEKILKVIIETCLLTEEEKIKMCEIVSNSGADFIKTSTGFAASGATFDDIKLFNEYVSPNVKIKAAGGIKTLEDAEKFINLGAFRLGTSRIVKIVKNM
ncbi:MAG: deoxyribose-phosphate aldolase, partial [Clostridia bacterium]|nr:deoxyribose-phosphate aldolase [Clostridia bacterium]